jgi:hypothetical protein
LLRAKYYDNTKMKKFDDVHSMYAHIHDEYTERRCVETCPLAVAEGVDAALGDADEARLLDDDRGARGVLGDCEESGEPTNSAAALARATAD